MKLSGILLIAALGATPLQAAANQASPAPMSMDCSTANATMMGSGSMPMAMSSPAAASSMSMDKTFVMQMHDMTMHGMQMAKLEAACGKDPKTRAMAAKMVNDLQNYGTQLQMMLEQQGG